MSLETLYLQQIYEDEERDSIVYAIREEIIENVMEECFKSYIEKQTTKFIVQCAFDAMIKCLSIEFYYHCEAIDSNNPLWVPDEPPPPSPRDTWAHGAVPVRKKAKKGEADKKKSETNENDKFRKECVCMDFVCTCTQSDISLSKCPYIKPTPSREKFKSSPKSSKVGMATPVEGSKILLEGPQPSEISTNKSNTKSVSTGALTEVSKDEVKRKKEKTFKGEVKLEVPSAKNRGSIASVVKLPPLRINTKFYSKEQTKKSKRKK